MWPDFIGIRVRNMGNTNRDASVTTSRRGQLALYSWRVANNYPQNATGTRPEQPGNSGFVGPTAAVPPQAYLGAQLIGQAGAGCACSTAVTLQGYDKKSPGC